MPFPSVIRAARVEIVSDEHRNRKIGWRGYYQRLKDFYRVHGHSNVPQRYPQDPSLGAWVARLRRSRKTLTDGQRKKLSEVAFRWERQTPPGWEAYYQRLKEFYRLHGHSNVPQRYAKDPSLGAWVGRQRGTRYRATLTDEQRKKLSEVEFSWELQDERFDRLWNESYEELKEYKARHGNCEVPTLYGRGQPRSLGAWTCLQKKQYHQGLLREDRKLMLNALGFNWEKRTLWGPDRDVEALEVMWQENYDKLVDFSRTYGHTLVPNLFVNGKAECLGRWVRAQRSSYLQKSLPEHRRKLLEEVGFVWIVLAKGHLKGTSRREWFEMYSRLLAYRSAHGDCLVPIDYAQDVELGRWVDEQRSRLKVGSIFPFRVERLDAIGFLMTKVDYSNYWNKQFKNLVAYQRKHKTTIIRHTSEGRLLRWTTAQRYLYRYGLLSTERKELLQSIGFDWRTTSRLSASPKRSTFFLDEDSDGFANVDLVDRGSYDNDSDTDSTDSFGREVQIARSDSETAAPDEIVFDGSPSKKRRLNFESEVGMALGRGSFDPNNQGSESVAFDLPRSPPSGHNINSSRYPDASKNTNSVNRDDPPLENRRGTGGCEPDQRTTDLVEIHDDRPEPVVESSFHSAVAEQCPASAESLCSHDELADDATADRERVPCSHLYPVGTRVRKHYEGYGWVSGEIAQFEGVYRVRYDDGDEEDFLDDDIELAVIVSQANANKKRTPVAGSILPLGTPVYKYFIGYGWFAGEIIAFDGVYLIRHDDGDEEELFYDSPEIASIVANAKQTSSKRIA